MEGGICCNLEVSETRVGESCREKKGVKLARVRVVYGEWCLSIIALYLGNEKRRQYHHVLGNVAQGAS